MSKSLTIDTAAVWAGTITVPTDGDTFQETVTDTYFDSIGDRLGYLKTQVDGAVSLGGTNTWTGGQTFSGTATFNDDVALNGTTEANSFTCSSLFVGSAGTFQSESPLTFSGTGALGFRGYSANTTANLSAEYDTCSVGTIAGNITLTLPAGFAGKRYRVNRNRTTDAFTVTVNNPSAVAMGTISANAAGWLEFERIGANWILIGYGGTVASLSTTTA
jgi:hypothetical protein